MHIYRFINRVYTVLLAKSIGDHFKLQLAHRANDNIVIAKGEKYLRAALFRQLPNTVLQLLGFEWVGESNALKQFGGKVWNAGELEIFPFGKCVADLNRTMVADQ